MKQRPFTAWDASEIGKHSKRPLKPGVSSVLLTAGTYSRGKQHLFDRVEGKLYRFRAAAAQLL